MRTDYRWTLAFLLVGGLFLGLVSWRAFFFSRMPTQLPDVYLELPPGEEPALAPDRPLLAYVSRHGDDWLIHLRQLEGGGGGVRRLPGTEGARNPFFSPDGRVLAFVASGVIQELVLGEPSGSPRSLASAGEQGLRGASFRDDGTIVFGSSSGIQWLSSSDGRPDTLVRSGSVEDAEARYGFPRALPQSKFVLFDVRRGPDRHIEALDVESAARHEVLADAALPCYAGDGRLLFVRGSRLWGIRFDPQTARARGEPVPLVSGLESGEEAWFDLSTSGVLVFRRPPTGRSDHRVAFTVFDHWRTELRRLLPGD